MLMHRMAKVNAIFVCWRKVDRLCLLIMDFLCLSGLMLFLPPNTSVITCQLLLCQLISLLLNHLHAENLTFLISEYGGVSVLLLSLMNCDLKPVLNDLRPFLWDMKKHTLDGVYVT